MNQAKGHQTMPKKNQQPEIIEGQIVDDTAPFNADYPKSALTGLMVIESNLPAAPVTLGEAANEYAAAGVFADYLSRTAENTKRRQRNDLSLFALFLECANAAASGQPIKNCFETISGRLKTPEAVKAGEYLQSDPAAWGQDGVIAGGITWGLVQEFRNWMKDEGYAIGSVNVRLATIKAYSKLAAKAGVISKTDQLLIADVKGYASKESKRINEGREVTRVGFKKADHTKISKEQADQLKQHPDSPQGRRDAVLMCLLLDHGLRCGEVALLQVSHFNLKDGTMTFYRPKVDKTQTHQLTPDTLKALRAYFNSGDATPTGYLLRGSRKGGKLTEAGMSERAITARVKELGEQIGIDTLSAHDLRHYWATRASRQGTDPFALQEAGGWASLEMPRRYVDAARIANAGVKL